MTSTIMPSALENNVDVLIVGAGPSGLMAAAWLARYGVNFRIIDKRDTRIHAGQADGLQSRTLEILDSFGFGNTIWHDANRMLEMCMWSPDPQGTIQRHARMFDTIEGISRFQQATLHQGRIEQAFEKFMLEHANAEVERRMLPISLQLDESRFSDDDAYPITVQLSKVMESPATPPRSTCSTPNGMFRSNLTPDDTDDLVRSLSMGNQKPNLETIHAKYLIGCDGAHSWVRKRVGIQLEGQQTDYVWGVLDIIPITDFPDIRQRCAVHSADSGSIMIIPRENKLVRLYCQLDKVCDGARVDRTSITPAHILARAQQILAPYQITYEHCSWYTAYQIGQRIASTFQHGERIFLAGDAVHTHSPKAGQGMNVSMQDTYNLGWKLASVVKGISSRSILSSYEEERRLVAQDLIEFDHKFSRLFSGRPCKDASDKDGVSMENFRAAYAKGNIFTSGVAVKYNPGLIVVGKPTIQESSLPDQESKPHLTSKGYLAPHIEIGCRMPSHQVLNQSDARPWQLQELLRSDGRWRVLVFSGDITKAPQMARVQAMATKLADTKSFSKRFTPASAPIDSVIEVLTVHSAPRIEVDLFDFPEILRPFSKKEGWDYWKIFVDDQSHHHGHGNAYDKYGISRETGCLVVVRPDQHVSYIGDLEDVDQVDQFFAAFMKAAS